MRRAIFCVEIKSKLYVADMIDFQKTLESESGKESGSDSENESKSDSSSSGSNSGSGSGSERWVWTTIWPIFLKIVKSDTRICNSMRFFYFPRTKKNIPHVREFLSFRQVSNLGARTLNYRSNTQFYFPMF